MATWYGEPSYSPDGRWIACQASDADLGWPFAGFVRVFPARDNDHAAYDLAPVQDDAPAPIGWSPDSRAVYAAAQHGFGSALYRLPLDGGAAEPLLTPTGVITATAANRNGQIAFVMEDFTTPQSVYLLDVAAASQDAQLIARPQAAAYPAGPLPQVRMLTWESPDGFAIEGVLYLPPHHDPHRDGKLPLLLHIHGGPARSSAARVGRKRKHAAANSVRCSRASISSSLARRPCRCRTSEAA